MSTQAEIPRDVKSTDDSAGEYCLQGYSPLASINLSEPDACRRLLQVDYAGIGPNSVLNKLKQADDRLSEASLRVWKAHVEAMERQCKTSRALRESDWTPIHYMWEILNCEGYSAQDFGNLVWIDKQKKNFLLVQAASSDPGPYGYVDLNAHLIRQAQKYFNLLHCLRPPNEVGFVRATWTTSVPSKIQLWTDDFLTGIASRSTRPLPLNPAEPPPIIHLSSRSHLVPAFHDRNLKAINTLLSWAGKGPVDRATRDLVLATPGQELTLPFVPKFLAPGLGHSLDRRCFQCREFTEREKLRKCSECNFQGT